MINVLKLLGIGVAFASALSSLNIGENLSSYDYIEIKSVDKIYTNDGDLIIENKYVPRGYTGDDRVDGYCQITNKDYNRNPYIAGR